MVHELYLNAHSRSHGSLFPRPTRVHVHDLDGAMLLVHPQTRVAPKHKSSSSSSVSRHQPSLFVDANFDESGKNALLLDSRGNVFCLSFHENRYAIHARHGDKGIAVSFSPGTRPSVGVLLRSGKLEVTNSSSHNSEGSVRNLAGIPRTLFFHPDGSLIGVCCDQEIRLFDLTNRCRLHTHLHKSVRAPGLVDATYDQKGLLLAVCNARLSRIFLLDAFSFHVLGVLEPWGEENVDAAEESQRRYASDLFTTVKFSPDQRYIVAGGRSRKIFLWDYQDFSLLRVVEIPEGACGIRQIEFDSSSQRLFILSLDGILRVVDIENFKLLFDIAVQSDSIVRFSLQKKLEKMLVAVLHSGKVLLYDVEGAHENYEKILLARGSKSESFLTSGCPDEELHNEDINELTPNTKSMFTSHARRVRTPPSGRRLSAWAEPADERTRYGTKPRPHPVVESSHFSVASDLDSKDIVLNFERLKDLLLTFGQYPDRYRVYIWRFLLSTSGQDSAFDRLLSRGIHPAFSDLSSRFQISSKRVELRLQKVLSALAYWCELFAEVEYVPQLIYPIVETIDGNLVQAFEICATYLLNWGRYYFEYFPTPPIAVLRACAEGLHLFDPELFAHLDLMGCSPEDTLWPMLRSSFSEVFCRGEWLQLFDHIFSNPPLFLPCVAVSYALYFRTALLKMSNHDQILTFFRRPNPVSLKHIISKAMRVCRDLSSSVAASESEGGYLPDMREFRPLVADEFVYAPFTHFPKVIVDSYVSEHNRIRAEEETLLRKKHSVAEIQRRLATLDAEERAWEDRHAALLRSEYEAREQLDQLQQNLLHQQNETDLLLDEARISRYDSLQRASARDFSSRETVSTRQALSGVGEHEVDIASMRREAERARHRAEEERNLRELEDAISRRWSSQRNLREEELFQKQLDSEIRARNARLVSGGRQLEQKLRKQDEERNLTVQTEKEMAERKLALRERMQRRRDIDLQLAKEEMEAQLQFEMIEHERRMRDLQDLHRKLLMQTEESERDLQSAREATLAAARKKFSSNLHQDTIKLAQNRADEYRQSIARYEKQRSRADKKLAEFSITAAENQLQQEMTTYATDMAEKVLDQENELQRMVSEVENLRRQAKLEEWELDERTQRLQNLVEKERKVLRRTTDAIDEERQRFQARQQILDDEIAQKENASPSNSVPSAHTFGKVQKRNSDRRIPTLDPRREFQEELEKDRLELERRRQSFLRRLENEASNSPLHETRAHTAESSSPEVEYLSDASASRQTEPISHSSLSSSDRDFGHPLSSKDSRPYHASTPHISSPPTEPADIRIPVAQFVASQPHSTQRSGIIVGPPAFQERQSSTSNSDATRSYTDTTGSLTTGFSEGASGNSSILSSTSESEDVHDSYLRDLYQEARRVIAEHQQAREIFNR